MTSITQPLFSLSAILYKLCFCSLGKYLVKINHTECLFLQLLRVDFALILFVFTCRIMGKHCDCSCLVIPTWNDHLTFGMCRLSAGVCTLDISNPCLICQSWLMITWGMLWKSVRDARQKSVDRGTQHWPCYVPALLT